MTASGTSRKRDIHFQYWRKAVDDKLQELVPLPADSAERVAAAMNHAVQGGHRWRPLFLIFAYEEVVGRDGWEVIDTACAVELIHCCTIILDDLPFVDNNTSLRRGKLPCHLVYGQAETVYASHLLYALAERLSFQNALHMGVDGERVRQQISNLREDLVKAQVLEINLKNGTTSVNGDSLEHLCELKSGLFVLAAWMVAAFGGLDSSRRDFLAELAACLGIAYQLTDDMIDAKAKFGQKVDEISFVTRFGFQTSKRLFQKRRRKVEQILTSISRDGNALAFLTDKMLNPPTDFESSVF